MGHHCMYKFDSERKVNLCQVASHKTHMIWEEPYIKNLKQFLSKIFSLDPIFYDSSTLFLKKKCEKSEKVRPKKNSQNKFEHPRPQTDRNGDLYSLSKTWPLLQDVKMYKRRHLADVLTKKSLGRPWGYHGHWQKESVEKPNNKIKTFP